MYDPFRFMRAVCCGGEYTNKCEVKKIAGLIRQGKRPCASGVKYRTSDLGLPCSADMRSRKQNGMMVRQGSDCRYMDLEGHNSHQHAVDADADARPR